MTRVITGYKFHVANGICRAHLNPKELDAEIDRAFKPSVSASSLRSGGLAQAAGLVTSVSDWKSMASVTCARPGMALDLEMANRDVRRPPYLTIRRVTDQANPLD